jgi:DNA-binding PadR family transcriptional regulator
MSDSSTLKQIADLTWSLELEGAKSAFEVVQKIVETKEAVEGATEKIGIRQDQQASDELREVRRFLDNSDLDLNGPECVLLGSFFKHREHVDLLDTRSLNVTLDSYGRKPSNTTSTVENLEKRGLIEFVAGENLHAHKTFRLTEQGYLEVRDLMGRLARKNFSAVS